MMCENILLCWLCTHSTPPLASGRLLYPHWVHSVKSGTSCVLIIFLRTEVLCVCVCVCVCVCAHMYSTSPV